MSQTSRSPEFLTKLLERAIKQVTPHNVAGALGFAVFLGGCVGVHLGWHDIATFLSGSNGHNAPESRPEDVSSRPTTVVGADADLSGDGEGNRVIAGGEVRISQTFNPEQPYRSARQKLESLENSVSALSGQFRKEVLAKHLNVTKKIIGHERKADVQLITDRLAFVEAYLAFLDSEFRSAIALAPDSLEESLLLRALAAKRIDSDSELARREVAKLLALPPVNLETEVFLLQHEFDELHERFKEEGATAGQISDAVETQFMSIDERAKRLLDNLAVLPGAEARLLQHDLLCLRLGAMKAIVDAQCIPIESGKRDSLSLSICTLLFTEMLVASEDLVKCEEAISNEGAVVVPSSAIGSAEFMVRQHIDLSRIRSFCPQFNAELSRRIQARFKDDKDRLLARLDNAILTEGGRLSEDIAAGLFTLGQAEFVANDFAASLLRLRRAKTFAKTPELRAKIEFVTNEAQQQLLAKDAQK